MTSLVVSDATLLTVDAHDRVWHHATVVADDGVIVYVGPSDGAPERPGATELSVGGAIVMPGLVNAHTHLAMTMFRGLADGVDLDGFLARVLPAEARMLSPRTVELGTRVAAAESLRAGITTALDMYFFPEAAFEAAWATGLRVMSGPVFVEFPGPDAYPFPERLAWASDWLSHAPSTTGSSRSSTMSRTL